MKPIIKKPSKKEEIEAKNWPKWEKEKSEFPWEYIQDETCLLIDGEVTVINEEGEEFHFGKGDYVKFPKGMRCHWKINKKVIKYFKLD